LSTSGIAAPRAKRAAMKKKGAFFCDIIAFPQRVRRV